jgi:hypothetical protein
VQVKSTRRKRLHADIMDFALVESITTVRYNRFVGIDNNTNNISFCILFALISTSLRAQIERERETFRLMASPHPYVVHIGQQHYYALEKNRSKKKKKKKKKRTVHSSKEICVDGNTNRTLSHSFSLSLSPSLLSSLSTTIIQFCN